MNKQRKLEKIKSSYIYSAIFKYINNPNFKYKLFTYSKSFQKKLGLKLIDYQEIYFEKLQIIWKKYISIYETYNYDIEIDNYDKDILKKNLQEDLLKYKIDINMMKTCIDFYCKKDFIALQEKYKGENLIFANKNEIIIDIFSPFFEFLSKKEYFSQLFVVEIHEKIIEKYKLINDYISAFEKLNRDNLNYTSLIFYYYDYRIVDYMTKFNINFNQIKKINFIKYTNFDNQSIFNINKEDKISFNITNDNSIVKNFFSFFNNIENNLLVLKINLEIDNNIEENSIKNLNQLKLLEYLELENFFINNDFTLKLFNLKKLFLSYCKNLTFEKDSLLKLNTLFLNNCLISKPESYLKCPNLEICTLIKNNQEYYLFFDFSSFKKLKNFISDIYHFINLKDTLLVEVELLIENDTPLEIEIEMFKKFLSIKTLTKIKFELGKLDNNQIAEIKGDNESIKIIDIKWKNENCILFNLQKKFPNASKIYLNCPNSYESYTSLEIKENKNIRIDTLQIHSIGKKNNIKLYCTSYDKLVDVEYKGGNIINIKESFPIFNDKCNVIFKNLINFKFTFNESISFKIFENIYYNLDNMPNLKYFKLDCEVENINAKLYTNFIQKILQMKLEYAFLWIKKIGSIISFFNKEELNLLFPYIDFSHLKSFVILKI